MNLLRYGGGIVGLYAALSAGFHFIRSRRDIAGVGSYPLVTLLRSAASAAGAIEAVDVTRLDSPGDTPAVAESMTCAWTSAEARSASDLPAALSEHPKYEPKRLLGSGGMGTVWLAQHRVMGRQVAVKVIRPEFVAKPGASERFRRETQSAARLQRPSVMTFRRRLPRADTDTECSRLHAARSWLLHIRTR